LICRREVGSSTYEKKKRFVSTGWRELSVWVVLALMTDGN
jgi:hypothetical protein